MGEAKRREEHLDSLPGEPCLAFVGVMTLVGRRVGERLEGALRFDGSLVRTGAGSQANLVYTAAPLHMLPSLRSVDLAGHIVVPLSELSEADRKAVLSAQAQGEKLAANIRASQTGIAIVPADAMPRAPAR